jgi:hypothetical protein
VAVGLIKLVAAGWRAVGPLPDPRTNNAYTGIIVGEPTGAGARDEAAYFFVCKSCGQAVDRRDLGQVFHDRARHHSRLPDN